MNHQINECWVYVAMPKDADEGIPAVKLNDLVLPMVASDQKRVDELRKYAQEIANMDGITVQLRKFTGCELVETFRPE